MNQSPQAARSASEKSEMLRALSLERKTDDAMQREVSGFRWRTIIIIASIAIAMLLGAYDLWRMERAPNSAAGSKIQSTAPSAGPAERDLAPFAAPPVAPPGGAVLEATGYVTARRMATVSAKVTGKVQAVYIEEGMAVDEGQILARLDPTDAEAALSLARAEQHAAEAQMAEIEARLAFAEREKRRQSELQKRDLASTAALDSAATDVATLLAQLASARAAVEVAVRAVAVSQTGLDNTVIRAPFSGIVIAKAAQPGEMISPVSAGGGFTRTGIGTIVDMDSLEVEVDVNEAYIQRVRPEQPVKITLNAYPADPLPGRVLAIIPAADRSKATVRVRVAFAARDKRAVPDMGARVSFFENAD